MFLKGVGGRGWVTPLMLHIETKQNEIKFKVWEIKKTNGFEKYNKVA